MCLLGIFTTLIFVTFTCSFSDWQVGMPIPTDICALYMIQFGFYVHSIYGTLYLDHWRKDSNVMLFHHIISCLLLIFSYATRWINNYMIIEGMNFIERHLYCLDIIKNFHLSSRFIAFLNKTFNLDYSNFLCVTLPKYRYWLQIDIYFLIVYYYF